VFVGSQVITGSICSNGNIVTTGQIVAQTINVQQVTSSIVYSCGSNIFGTDISNTQQFTGSMLITGSNITANVGTACFQGNVCASTLVVNKSNPILYINSGNNETSTIGFTQGAVEGYGGFIKVTTGLGDRAMTFGLSAAGTNNDATELIRLDDSGVTCFKNAICSPIAELTSDASCVPLRLINGVITGGSTAGVTGLYFGDAGSGVNMIQREKYAANQANLILYSEYGYGTQSINGCFGYNGVAFYTAGTKRQRIDGNGITCFAGIVCAPNHIASSTCSTASLRVYGASGTHQWDLYLNGNNLRFSDNTSCAGCFVVDNTATFGGYVGVGTSPLTKLHLYDSSPNYILLTNTGADGVSNAIQGGIIGQSRGYSNNLAQMANILFRNKNTAAWYKGEISFSTNDSDGTNPAVSAVERMRIFSDGITCLSNTFCTPQLYLQQDSNSEVQFLSANNQNCTGTSSAARIDIGTWINQYALTLGRNGI
jgi:hypothetical protein